jgi:predicted acyl esterase
MTVSRFRIAAFATALLLAVVACSPALQGVAFGATEHPKIDLADAASAPFVAHGSVNQVWLEGARPGEALQLVDRNDRLVATANTDERGSLIFRDVARGSSYRVAGDDASVVSAPVDVTVARDTPDDAFYARQQIGAGYGYLETRDGTLLAINVKLPGPPENGPYPTVIEYSGYSPADPRSPQPSTLIAGALGFATVGVNVRGTGCSGGAFQFFETLQSTDGYDIVETIAAQPWVAHGKVGMVGISYPGISQLFVAALRPPHLAAIAPLSVIADTGRGTLRPGGIYNNGFAKSWAEDRNHDAQAAPESGQAWAGDRIQSGDATCAANQNLREQAPDALQMIADNPYWNDLAESLAPESFVDQIDVPTFLAGAWQDEQTGPYFANMLDDFDTDKAWFTITNGGHTDSLDPAVFDRWIEFLQIYVAQVVPKRPAVASTVAQVVGTTVWGVPVTLPPDRFANATSLAEARATFEADPRLRILFENGAGDAPGLPYARFEGDFAGWPVPTTRAETWYFGAGSQLLDAKPQRSATEDYAYDTSRAQTTTLSDADEGAAWAPLPPWNWPAPPADSAVAYETDPLRDDTVMVGTGSVDLWMKADAPDVDLQATVTEVRPDGQEVYVQSGWLRASQRRLAGGATALRPLHTNEERDVQPLNPDRWNNARIELFPFGHVFRAGSKVRIIVDTPGASRPRWKFDVLQAPPGTRVHVALGGTYPSRVLLPVVGGVDAPPGLPPCPSLRGQPCRAYTPL